MLAGLDALGVDYKYNFIDYFAGGQKDPGFVKNINPSATVPAAVDGDLHLTESNAILQYAADLNGESKLYPKDLKQRANINRWLLWEASVWFGSCYVYLIENTVKPELFGAEPDKAAVEKEAPNFDKLAKILDTQLGKTKYIAGDNLSIADIAIAAPLHLHPHMDCGLDRYPSLQRWIQSIESESWWKKTQGPPNEKIVPSKFKGKENGGNKVRASFNYTQDLGSKLTELYFYEDVAAQGIHEPGDDAREMDVHDGWSRAKEFDLDTHGFCLKGFEAGYAGSWEDEGKVKEEFYPEVVEFLKRETGAKRVLVFDHTIRTAKNAQKKLTQETNTSQRAVSDVLALNIRRLANISQPVSLVHCDYTARKILPLSRPWNDVANLPYRIRTPTRQTTPPRRSPRPPLQTRSLLQRLEAPAHRLREPPRHVRRHLQPTRRFLQAVPALPRPHG